MCASGHGRFAACRFHTLGWVEALLWVLHMFIYGGVSGTSHRTLCNLPRRVLSVYRYLFVTAVQYR